MAARTTLGLDELGGLMTVQQLIDRLREFPPQMEVTAFWDSMADWPIHRVEPFEGTVVIDCSSSDWDWHGFGFDVRR